MPSGLNLNRCAGWGSFIPWHCAPLRTPWSSFGEVPSGVNLNQYAGCGSSILWHSDDEPLFGDQSDPKVIVKA